MAVYKMIWGRKLLIGSVKAQMRESLYGGLSTSWNIEARVQYVDGDPYSFYWMYNCGINVPKKTDWMCNTYEADANGTWDEDLVHGAVGSVSDSYYASFGSSETGYAKFPLVHFSVYYHDGGRTISDNLYLRGWDIRARNGRWQLASATGLGG
jgi:hypothetical protein